jgi:hypothetical protein
MAVTAFLVGASVAQAVSVEWGGELRPRFEYNEQAFFNSSGGTNQGTRDGDYFVSSRVRLHAKADILPDTSAFIQLQSVRNWGNDLGALNDNVAQANGAGPGGGGSTGGSGNAAFSPSDNDNTVGIHQAYFTLKNFATLPVDLQVGRQEVVLDGHRILGNTGWTQGAQTHDAVRVQHTEGNHTLAYVYSLANEGSRGTTLASSANDDEDVEVHVIYANMQGILGGGLSLYFVGVDDDCSAGGGAPAGTGCRSAAAGGAAGAFSPSEILDNNNYTVGIRQAGQLFGIDYRGEFYYQFGDAEGDALSANAGAGGAAPYSAANLKGADRSAYMFGARVGKKFNNVMWKPSLTFWYDYLSGTSDEDARDGDYKTFNTLFDTGHKFYGFMDLFLPANGANTNFLGLVDYAVKASVEPAKDWTFKTDWHYFTTAEGVEGNTRFSGSSVAGAEDDNFLGHELDLTLVHKYNANTTISAGWSQFWQESSFELLNGAASSTATVTPAQWAYLMFDVKF